MEREMGSKFTSGKKKLEVAPEIEICEGCSWEFGLCHLVKNERGECSADYREDQQGVIFKEV